MRYREQDAWDEYREVIRVYRNETRKAEAPLELNMAKGCQRQQELFQLI